MKLLGEPVWRYTMVLFTCGDFLGEKTIEQHIETEGDALRWLVKKCRNRYHVFNNKKSSDTSQVTHLLKKIDEMVWYNNGSYYEVDEQTLNIIQEKQQEVAERATKRRRRAEEQRQQMKKLIPEEKKTILKLQMILLGSRGVGKTSVGNAILGMKEQEDGKRTTHSVARQGFVSKTDITLVDTPGWWKDFLVCDTPAAIREELMLSMFLCRPGPHVFLLMIDSDAPFNRKHLEAVKTHMELLGEGVWRHTILVFTRGDWLGAHSIEEYIEGEGEALQMLVEQCGNRYHVIDNKNADDGTQIKEMLETITGTVAVNNWDCFVPDENIYSTIVEKRRRVEEGARLRHSLVKAKKKSLEGSRNKLQDLRIVMLGQKTSGKSATGNNLLHKEVFPTYQNEQCHVEKAEVDGRLVTVIDTPGWWVKPSNGTEEIEKEIVRGISLSPLGVHAILLVVPLDLTFRHPQQVALEEHMSLFDSSVWKNAIVLFTYGDKLAEKSIEEHIEKEHSALRWLVDKCENRYHVMSNIKKNDTRQVTELFEKIEEMVAGNSSRLFCPDMNDIQERLLEMFSRRQIKQLVQKSIEDKYRRRELELLMGFRETLFKLQSEIRGSATSLLPRSKIRDLDRFKIKGIGHSKKDEKEENLDAKISQEIENLNKDIMRSTDLLRQSMDFLIPDFKGESPESTIAESLSERRTSNSYFDKVASWLTKLQITTNVDNQLSLDFSQSSGYRSELPKDPLDFHMGEDNDSIILRTPASPVFEGDAVSLICQYWTGNNRKTIFFKNGAQILASTSSISGRQIKMTIENVTQEDEGFYKCASTDRQMESPESWLSVRPERGNATTTDGTAASTGEKESFTLREARLILIGQRWAGKSLSGNTILKRDRFECGRTRTSQSEARHEEVEGRHLVVVDAPGWNSLLSLKETPQGERQRFKLNVSKCPPGPHVFLLVIPIDTSFCAEQRRTVEEHMKLLGEQVWRYTMVLFTCGDFLGEKTIEQHIETEGDALRWLVEKCRNRYHVFINKKSSDTSQVTHLLKKIDEMVWYNNGSYYEVDEQTLNIIQEKQQEVAERATKRRRRAEEQRQQMKKLIPEEKKTIPKLQMILLGSRGVGKTSVGNAILGMKEQEDGKRTTHSVARRGLVSKTDITLVDTPGWWKDFLVYDTPAAIREELMLSMFLCRPGPHVFLLMIDSDASFNHKHLEAVKTHMELLGEGVWRHTILVFTRGDWLGAQSIEEYIEGEGEALQMLVEQCGNRYHVIDNKNADDGTQIKEMLETITGTVAVNNRDCFVPDENIYSTIVEKRRRVEEGARLRHSLVKAKKKSLEGSMNKLQDLRIVMLGQKTFGKSATGNNLLHKEVFPTYQNEQCHVEKAEVDGRLVTVIDTPGWWVKLSNGTEEIEKEIVKGISLSPLGVHAILLVVPLDLTFRHPQQVAMEEHMSLFDSSVWKNAIVLFTYGDKLAEKSIEEHIEKEHSALRWLVDKCENRYHVMSNIKKNDTRQVTELFEKIEEMVAGNSSRLFCPDMNDIQERLIEKFRKRQIKQLLKKPFEDKYRRRELELLMGFRETLLKLQSEIRGSATSLLPRSKIRDLDRFKIKGIGQSKKDEKEENLDAKISQEIENLNKDIMRSTDLLGKSMDFLLPEFKGESPGSTIAESLSERRTSNSHFDKVASWLTKLQITTNVDNQLSLDFSQSSGYRSVLPKDPLDFHMEEDITG
ncbi:uncharacterized protein LKV04_022495 [Tautogolabrus adspersus]